MGPSDLMRLAAENGCEIVPLGNGRVQIRAISYDADPFEVEERQLLGMSPEEFITEWIPPRFEY